MSTIRPAGSASDSSESLYALELLQTERKDTSDESVRAPIGVFNQTRGASEDNESRRERTYYNPQSLATSSEQVLANLSESYSMAHVLQKASWYRLVAFVVLELGYLGLALAACRNPIPIRQIGVSMQKEASGFVTVVVIGERDSLCK